MPDHTESEVAEIHGYANAFTTEQAAETHPGQCEICGETIRLPGQRREALDMCGACAEIVDKQDQAESIKQTVAHYPGLRDRYETAQAKKRGE
jgi:RNA polymerase-binding transcription factor DksA